MNHYKMDYEKPLRTRVCKRCRKCYKGTRKSDICPTCRLPNTPYSKNKRKKVKLTKENQVVRGL